jgi:clathrin heavy chain
MIRACEEAHLWPELVFIYCYYDEWDNAALAMMERPADAWEYHSFKDIIVKVANLEIYYRALNFYLQQLPSHLTDLLQALTLRIDVNRVVKMFEKSDNIPLIEPFLLNVQTQNKKVQSSRNFVQISGSRRNGRRQCRNIFRVLVETTLWKHKSLDGTLL